MVADLVRRENQRLYSKTRTSKHVSGKSLSKFQKGYFIGWDGEGIETGNLLPNGEKEQLYVLLANSEDDYILHNDGISTISALDFLTSSKYPSNCIHCCFGASYDVTKILIDLPENSLRLLHDGDNYVSYGQYELEYRARKSLTIRKMKVETRNGKQYKIYDHKKKKMLVEKTVVLWDVIGFFQKKFILVLQEWLKGTEYEYYLTDGTLSFIQENKNKRGSFTDREIQDTILPYCLKECRLLKILMQILHRYIKDAGLVLNRWDGAGAAAAALLSREQVKRHIRIGEHLDEECLPQEVVLASEYAYYGGWAECFLFGSIDGPIYRKDICSAYPSVMPLLPSLVQGSWHRWKSGNMLPLEEALACADIPDGSFYVGHIQWKNGPKYGPGPFNFRHHTGNILRPTMGQGWQWSPEIQAAWRNRERFLNNVPLEIMADDIMYFQPETNATFPFGFVRPLYDLRRSLKRRGIGYQIVLKLALNSLYGKLAQSLGYNERRGIKPPFHNLVYAGLITSFTRAKIMDAVLQHPSDIISIATDGVYSRRNLQLDEGSGLGQWEPAEFDKMTIIQSGFYWLKKGDEVKYYYRGMNEGCLTMSQVDSYYEQDAQCSLPVPVTRFCTLGTAIGLNRMDLMGTWRTVDRYLDMRMQSSFKRTWTGNKLPGTNIKVSEARFSDQDYLERLYTSYPEYRESKKYKYEWDEKFDGEPERQIVEEMAHMELSPF